MHFKETEITSLAQGTASQIEISRQIYGGYLPYFSITQQKSRFTIEIQI